MAELTGPSELSATDVIAQLGLAPLPGEGGYFRETHRSTDRWPASALPARFVEGDRAAGTAIYYLLTPSSFSALHRCRADEVYHFYRGDPVALATLTDAGELRQVTLGSAFEKGQLPQFVIPAGVWQGSRLVAGGRWALLGTTVTPGFEFRDWELAPPALLERFPHHQSALGHLLVG